MNALAMLEHCGFHQRVISREAICPLCSRLVRFLIDPARDYIGRWDCSNGCQFLTPVFREMNPMDCPQLHTHQTL